MSEPFFELTALFCASSSTRPSQISIRPARGAPALPALISSG